jgi:hypothetical protein
LTGWGAPSQTFAPSSLVSECKGASLRILAANLDTATPTGRLMGVADDVTVHGFHVSFRDWAGNEMHFPRELAEHALAHVIGDKPEQAYRRDAALERRRPLMAAWAVYCEPSNAKFSSKQHLTSAGEGRERRQLTLEIAAAAASLSL